MSFSGILRVCEFQMDLTTVGKDRETPRGLAPVAKGLAKGPETPRTGPPRRNLTPPARPWRRPQRNCKPPTLRFTPLCPKN